MILAGAILGACSSGPLQRPQRVTYRVENVRGTEGGGVETGEIDRIVQVISKYADGEVDLNKTRSTPFGRQRFYDYEVRFEIANLNDLVDIDRDLSRLFHSHSGADGIQFRLTDAGLTYRSNYVAVGTEVALRGVTAPGAMVRLRVGDDVANGNGFWRHALMADPGKPFIYGFSEDRASAMRRYFRINLLSQAQEPVTESAYTAMFPDDIAPP